jgi:hypothetical protein
MAREPVELERIFEGAEILDALLRSTGSPLSTHDVLGRMQTAIAEDGFPGDVIPRLFENEPRFADPVIARALYGNLLGLWDLLSQGEDPAALGRLPLQTGGDAPDGVQTPVRPRRAARPPPPPRRPEPFGEAGPDLDFVESAWQYLAVADRERERLAHSFENRQDALLGALDELELPDEADAVARTLLFELHAMLELGWGARVRRLSSADLRTEPSPHLIPPALAAYVDESVFEAEQDEEQPLPPDFGAMVRKVARAGWVALWSAGSE